MWSLMDTKLRRRIVVVFVIKIQLWRVMSLERMLIKKYFHTRKNSLLEGNNG
jgi:hypothetical protein